MVPGADQILFVINPKAGTRYKRNIQDQLLASLDPNRFQVHIAYTEYEGHAFEISRKAVQDRVPYLVAVGGDGTVNECASSLVATQSTLGIIPLGSGNGLARDLGVPLEIEKALQIMNHHAIKTIDCGATDHGYFFCTAGVGFDAYISERFTQSKHRGLMGYLRKVVEEFLIYENQEYRLELTDQARSCKAFSITFANAAQFGNNAFISPHADITDGKLDMCIVKDYPKHLGLSLGLRLFNRSIHKSRYVEIIRLEEAVIKCPRDCVYHMDGEVKQLVGSELKVKVVPQALRVMVPKV